VFTLTGSPAQTGLLTALEAVPYLLFGLLAGALADRVDRRRLMVGGDLLRAALVGSVPLAAALGVLKLPHVYLAALGVAVVFVWADAASFGALPALIGRQRLPAANSARWSASTTLTITGPAVAGVLVATVEPTPALWVDAASYLASALLLASIRRSFQHRQEGDTPARPGPGPPGHRGGPPLPVAPPAGPAAHPGRVRQQPPVGRSSGCWSCTASRPST
jgi:MFS family permease